MNDSYEMLMTVAALNGLGALLKNATPVSNKWIPTVLAIAGAVIFPLLNGTWSPVNVINGFLAGVAAVGTHQVVTQIKNGKTNENKTEVTTPGTGAGGTTTGSAPVA